jgi:hypothetical protein
MTLASKRARVSVMVLGLAFLAGLCCLVILMGQDQQIAMAAGTASSRITNVELKASMTPTSIIPGQEIQLSLSVSTRGGPGPVTITAIVPKHDGSGRRTARATIMFDRDATYGFNLPLTDTPDVPGTYAYTFRAQVGAISIPKSRK